MSRFSAMPKWFRVSTYLVLAYLTYALLIGIVTPAVLKAKLPNLVKENIGRNATVEEITINPFLLKIDISHFVIYSAPNFSNNGEHFFSVGDLSLDFGFWQSLFSFTPAIESLTVDAPYISLARLSTDNNVQRFNFSDILSHIEERSAKEPSASESSKEGQIPRITLGDFVLREGHVVIEDKVTETLLDYPELDVALQDLDTHALISGSAGEESDKVATSDKNAKTDQTTDQPKGELAFNQYQFNLLTAEKGKIAVNGEFQLSPLKITTDVAINDVALTPLWSLSKDLIEANLVNGTASLSLHAEVFEQDKAFQFILERGEFAINNLTFNAGSALSEADGGRGSQKILAVPAFSVHDINVHALDQRVSISEVVFDDVRVLGLLDEAGLDLQRLFTPKEMATATAKTSSGETPNESPNAQREAQGEADLNKGEADLNKGEADLNNGESNLSEGEAQAGNSESQVNEGTSQEAQSETGSESSKGTLASADNLQKQSQDTSWYVELQQFVFNNGTIDMVERSVSGGTYYRISSVNIKTGAVTSDFSKPITYSTSLHVGADTQAFTTTPKGTLFSSGSVNIADQAIRGKATVEQLLLNQFQQYISPYANVTLEEGLFNLDAEFNAEINEKDSAALNAKASTSITNLSVLDNAKTPLLQWQSLNVDDIEFDQVSNQLSVDNIRLQAPFARLIIDESKQTNVGKLVVASNEDGSVDKPSSDEGAKVTKTTSNANKVSPTNTENESSEADALAIKVNAISIENGKAYFADHSLTPKFASTIESLNGKVLGIDSSSTQPANVDITGKIDNYAPVKLAGTIHPLKSDVDLNLNFSVQGAELTSVNPYSGTYMGYYIDKGLLSLDVQYKLNGKALEGKNHVVIDQLTLGKKSNSDQALSLPLGLAIALLEDSNGVIDLGLDVSGDIDNPDFSFGSIILNAIGNIITKAVTAPFSLLANLVGSDDELDNVEFAFGEQTLNADAREKLDTLAKALKKRPGLRVNIEGTVNAISDASALAQRQLNHTLLTRSGQADADNTSVTTNTVENSQTKGLNAGADGNDSSSATSITGSSIPLEGPLANSLLSYYVEVFTPDLTQERTDMVAKLYPNLAKEQSQLNSNGNKNVINETEVQRALSIARYNKLRNNIDIPESELNVLADARSKAVKNYLANTAEIEANRLFLLNTQHDLRKEFSGVELTLEAN
nr:DUF748 domain-containing protein [Alteromonas abrolhosensis]